MIDASFLRFAAKSTQLSYGLEQFVLVRRLVEIRTGGVEPRHAGIAATGKVDRREVERQTQQVVAERAGHELVDLVARPAASCRG